MKGRVKVREATDVRLMNHLDELAAFEPTSFPFISLYLNMPADRHGRDNFESFVRKEFKAKANPSQLNLRSFTTSSEMQRGFKLSCKRVDDDLRRLRRRRKIRGLSARQLWERKNSQRATK